MGGLGTRKRRLTCYVGAIPILLSLLAGPVAAQTTGKNPSHSDILRGFDASPLYADRDAGKIGAATGATLTGVVHKWTRPIIYRVEGMLYDKEKVAFAIKTLIRIADMAGVKIREAAANNDEANFVISFTNVANFTVGGMKASCYATSNFDKWTGTYRNATMHINLGSGPDITRCVIHETLHAFGLNGHPHKLHSILSYFTERFVFDLTEPDEVMLRTLYDPRMKPGTSRLPALVLADGIIEEKRRALNPNAPPQAGGDTVFREALADFEKAAAGGNVKAMLHLAEASRFGIVVPQDETKMRQLIDQAARQNDPAQVFDLAYALAAGYFVPKDEARAATLYRRNAEAGHLASQNNLAVLLRDGKGVTEDRIEALAWFNIAARNDYALAERNRQALLPLVSAEGQAEARRRAATWKPVAEAAK